MKSTITANQLKEMIFESIKKALMESDRHRPGYYTEYAKKKKERGESADRHRPGYYAEYARKKKEDEELSELPNLTHIKKKSNDRHKPGYYHKYNQEHPERLERGFTKGYIDGKVSNGPEIKQNGNIWYDNLGRPHSNDPYNPTFSDLLDAKEQEWHDDDWEESGPDD